MSARLAPTLAALALLVPVVALVGRLALFATHSAEMIAFPWQIDYDEGVILHSSWLMANGQTPYPPITPDRFVSSVYPPLFYALNAFALKVWGLNLWSGRGLSLLGALLAAGSLLAWTFAETRSRAAGLLAAALWLSAGPVIVWATFYKQDVLALGFGALGCAMLAWGRRAGGPIPRLEWLAILPLVLAFWTKQSTLAPLVAGGLYMLGSDRRSGMRWCLCAGAALVGPFLLLNLALGGQLYTHLFLPGAEALSGARLGKNLGALWGEGWPVIILAGVAGVALLGWAVRTRRVPPLSLLYAAVSMPAMFLTNLSPLANYNHLLIGLLPLCLLAGVGLGHAAALPNPKLRVGLLAAGVVVLLILPSLLGPIKNWYTPLGQPLDEKAARFDLLERAVASAPGSALLAEDAWLALRAGKNLPYDDPAMMAIQANARHWDERAFLNDIARRRFGLVVLEQDITNETTTPRWSVAALTALRTNYAVKSRDIRFLAAPLPAPATPPDARDCTIAGGPSLVGSFLPGGGARLAPGDLQELSLYWSAPAAGAAPEPVKFSLLLRDPIGKAAWQADLLPGEAAGQPWPSWQPGASPRDDLQIRVPANAPAGNYSLILSAYLPAAGGLRPVRFACGDVSGPALTLATPEMAP